MRNLPTFCLRIRILIILTKSAVMLCIFLLLTSCAQLGLDLVKAGRNDYNIVLQQTEDDEVILNLVRVRYGDRPLFFDVNSVTTSFTWSQNAAASGTMLEYGGSDFQRNNLSIRGDLQYTERPTITYTPLGGKDFVKSVLTPADLVSIRSQTKKPDNAQVAIKYRGSWFYINDSDLNTKYSFLLLDQLAALLGGKVETAGPLLTLPVSAP